MSEKNITECEYVYLLTNTSTIGAEKKELSDSFEYFRDLMEGFPNEKTFTLLEDWNNHEILQSMICRTRLPTRELNVGLYMYINYYGYLLSYEDIEYLSPYRNKHEYFEFKCYVGRENLHEIKPRYDCEYDITNIKVFCQRSRKYMWTNKKFMIDTILKAQFVDRFETNIIVEDLLDSRRVNAGYEIYEYEYKGEIQLILDVPFFDMSDIQQKNRYAHCENVSYALPDYLIIQMEITYL